MAHLQQPHYHPLINAILISFDKLPCDKQTILILHAFKIIDRTNKRLGHLINKSPFRKIKESLLLYLKLLEPTWPDKPIRLETLLDFQKGDILVPIKQNNHNFTLGLPILKTNDELNVFQPFHPIHSNGEGDLIMSQNADCVRIPDLFEAVAYFVVNGIEMIK